jgi:hypothetical protein
MSTLNSTWKLGEVDLLASLEHAQFAINGWMLLGRNRPNEAGHLVQREATFALRCHVSNLVVSGQSAFGAA